MAGLPLKSGADFYNLEAARLRLHNLGADPTEVGAGLIYFNTSTGLNTSQKARLYTGSAWKTIAFSEDLDVASNADFLALKDKVDLLSGDVDTDAIISNMKEVSAFLEGFAEDASLMDLLKGKFDKVGGTLHNSSTDTPLKIVGSDTGAFIAFASTSEFFGYIGANVDKKPYFYVSGQSYEILTSAGGTIEGKVGVLQIKRNNAYDSLIRFSNTSGQLGLMGFDNNTNPIIYKGNDELTPYTLLHSGNVGDYALKVDGSNAMNADVGIKWTNGSLNADNVGNYFVVGTDVEADSTLATLWGKYSTFLNVAGNVTTYRFQLASKANSASNNLAFRSYTTSGWNAWKTIAFTDSTVDKAKMLVSDNGSLVVKANDNQRLEDYRNLQIYESGTTGADAYPYYQSFGSPTQVATVLQGGSLIALKTNGNERVWVNSSGNVTIGASDLAGSNAKLHIEDTRESSSYLLNARFLSPNLLAGGTSTIIFGKSESNKNRAYIGYTHNSDGSDSNAITFGFYGKDKIVNFLANGNVLIGTTEDNGAKLQVNGNISLGNAGDSEIFFNRNYINRFVATKSGGYFAWRVNGSTDDAMTLNAGGNVLIGTTENNGAKLQVAGRIVSRTQNDANKVQLISDSDLGICMTSNGSWMHIAGSGASMFIYNGEWDSAGTGNYNKGITITTNNNIGIGTTNPQEKLDIEGGIRVNGHIYPKWGNNSDLGKNSQRWNNIFAVKASFTEDVIIDGDLHVKGNIIADGEVSAGGAGTEGGNTSGSGAGAFHSEGIAVGATQTTIAHGLGTDDIVVSIYEKDGVSGRWSIILTDVEIVDANNIIVSFGSATTVEHKVVIMGAVA